MNDLSNILNNKIDAMYDSFEFQVNSTIERLMVENLQSFEPEIEIDSNNREDQSYSDLTLE